MTETRTAIIDPDGLVTNVELIDDTPPELPPGHTARELTDADRVGPRHRWDGHRWQPPELPDEPPAPDDGTSAGAPVTRAEFDALQAQLDLTTALLLEAR